MSVAEQLDSRTDRLAKLALPARDIAIDTRFLSQASMLELMRIASGLSYTELARLAGMPRHKLVRVLKGTSKELVPRWLKRVRDLLWERLRPDAVQLPPGVTPTFLTLPEAQEALGVTAAELRRRIYRDRSLGAIKIGKQIRIPTSRLGKLLVGPRTRLRSGAIGATRQGLAVIFRVSENTLRHAVESGKIAVVDRKRKPHIIPPAEVRRLLRMGTAPIELPRKLMTSADRGSVATRRPARGGGSGPGSHASSSRRSRPTGGGVC